MCTYIHVCVKNESGSLEDDDVDDSVKVKYAEETEQAEDTRELADGGTEGAPVDDTATDEYERSLDELDAAAETSLDVEDRTIGVLTIVWSRAIISNYSIYNWYLNQNSLSNIIYH